MANEQALTDQELYRQLTREIMDEQDLQQSRGISTPGLPRAEVTNTGHPRLFAEGESFRASGLSPARRLLLARRSAGNSRTSRAANGTKRFKLKGKRNVSHDFHSQSRQQILLKQNTFPRRLENGSNGSPPPSGSNRCVSQTSTSSSLPSRSVMYLPTIVPPSAMDTLPGRPATFVKNLSPDGLPGRPASFARPLPPGSRVALTAAAALHPGIYRQLTAAPAVVAHGCKQKQSHVPALTKSALTCKTSLGQDNVSSIDELQESFPQKLYRLLMETEEAGMADIISFMPSGKTFSIHKPDQFMKMIVPHFFQHSRLSSFTRQLQLYQFRRIVEGTSVDCYFNANFCKGKPELLHKVHRTKRLPKGKVIIPAVVCESVDDQADLTAAQTEDSCSRDSE